MTAPHADLPRLRDLARHALPHAVESSVVPVVLFYGTLRLVGVWTALLAALAWCYVGLVRRFVRRRPVPALLVLAALGLTARTVVAFASGSVFVYFLQPTLTTVAVACAFLLSVPAGRPLAKRLATDLFPLPEAMLARPAVERIFGRITLLWGAINLANAAVTVLLLVSVPVETYVLSKTAVTFVGTVGGVLLSTWWFRRALRVPVGEPGVAAAPV
ncbi:MAG TPA: VC0807 family protein, partial [Acidimicrobiales bacterium]